MTFRLFLLVIIALFIQCAQNINPYHALQLEEGATQQQIRKKYKHLKKLNKNNKVKQELYGRVYQQIMLESTLQMTLANKQQKKTPKKQNRRNRRRRRGLPRLSDMFRRDYSTGPEPQRSGSQKAFQMEDEKNYAQQIINQHGYQLPPQLDDPYYHPTQRTAEQILRDQNVTFNIKAARFIFFIGGILLKLSPCICLYFMYKYRRQNPRDSMDQEVNPFIKAANGWSGRNRRPLKKTK